MTIEAPFPDLAAAAGARRPSPAAAALGVAAELRRRQPALARFGAVLLALAVPTLLAAALDPRTLAGEGVWVKPLKFELSVALFALTTAWFLGYVPAHRRRSRAGRAIVGTILAAGTFEIAYIALQAGRGQASHFNDATALSLALYGAMGVAALLLTGTALLLAREVARHGDPALPRAFRLAVVLGLVLTFALGAGAGMYMSAQPGHAVAAGGGAAIGDTADGAGRLPLLGWSTTQGDLRVPHFLGIHAQQILPAAGAVLAALLPAAWAVAAVWAAAAAYVLLTAALLMQAVAGLPLGLALW